MFENLSAKLDSIFRKLRGHGKLTEQNIQEALKEVRIALLEADVNFRVVKDFIQQVQGRAVGQEVMDSLTPAQQLIKIVKEEITSLIHAHRRFESRCEEPRCFSQRGSPSQRLTLRHEAGCSSGPKPATYLIDVFERPVNGTPCHSLHGLGPRLPQGSVTIRWSIFHRKPPFRTPAVSVHRLA